jgi:hypothetical protein
MEEKVVNTENPFLDESRVGAGQMHVALAKSGANG